MWYLYAELYMTTFPSMNLSIFLSLSKVLASTVLWAAVQGPVCCRPKKQSTVVGIICFHSPPSVPLPVLPEAGLCHSGQRPALAP